MPQQPDQPAIYGGLECWAESYGQALLSTPPTYVPLGVHLSSVEVGSDENRLRRAGGGAWEGERPSLQLGARLGGPQEVPRGSSPRVRARRRGCGQAKVGFVPCLGRPEDLQGASLLLRCDGMGGQLTARQDPKGLEAQSQSFCAGRGENVLDMVASVLPPFRNAEAVSIWMACVWQAARSCLTQAL